MESIVCDFPDGCKEPYAAWEDQRILLVSAVLAYDSRSVDWQTALYTLDVVSHCVRCAQVLLRHLQNTRVTKARRSYSEIGKTLVASWTQMLVHMTKRNEQRILTQAINGGMLFCLEQLSLTTDSDDFSKCLEMDLG